MNAAKGYGQILSNEKESDSWFSGVETVEELNEDVVNYFGTFKTSHKGFSLLRSKIN